MLKISLWSLLVLIGVAMVLEAAMQKNGLMFRSNPISVPQQYAWGAFTVLLGIYGAVGSVRSGQANNQANKAAEPGATDNPDDAP